MKRINVRLLVIMLCAFFVFVVAVYGMYTFQMGRAAQTMLVQADNCYQAGDLKVAITNLQRYLQYHPEDHEQLARLALWTKEWFESLIAEGTPVGPKEFQRAWGLIEKALRSVPDNFELREAAVDFGYTYRRDVDAISHLTYIIEKMSEKATEEHYMKRAECHVRSGQDALATEELAKMIGFDYATNVFDASRATMPGCVDAYMLLANLYRTRGQTPETAELIIRQMVDANKDSAHAYMQRANYSMSLRMDRDEELQRAKIDIDKAIEMSPNDDDVIVAAAIIYQELDDFALAKDLLDRYRENNPEQVGVYRLLSNWALQQNDIEQARIFIDQGLEKEPSNPGLLWARGNLELQNLEFDKVEKTVDALRQMSYPKQFLQFLEARMDMARGNVIGAVRTFNEIRPDLKRMQPEWIAGLDRALALCHERLGQHDQRLLDIKRLLDANPGDLQALWGEILALRALGQADKALNRYRSLSVLMQSQEGFETPTSFLISHLEMELMLQNRRPEDERSWQTAESLANRIWKQEDIRQETKLNILRRYFEEIGDQSRLELIVSQLNKLNPDQLTTTYNEIRQTATTDITKALRDLDELEEQKGESVASVLLRIKLLTIQPPIDMKERLVEIESKLGTLNDTQQAMIYEDLGTAYFRLSEFDEVRRVWQEAAKKLPQNIDIWIKLFEFELLTGEEADMVAALDGLKTVAGADSAAWKYGEAARIVWRVRNELDDAAALEKSRALLEEAKGLRAQWDPLYRLEAEIFSLQGNTPMALFALEKALEYGPPRRQTIVNLARLLAQSGRYDEARQRMEVLDRSTWTEADKTLYRQIQHRLGQVPEDLAVDENSTDPLHFLQVGTMLTSARRFEEAEKAIRRSLESAPSLPEGWRALVYVLAVQGRREDAEGAVREARVEVSEEAAPLLLGKCFEILGNYGEALQHYQMHLNGNPESLEAMRSIATLYMAAKKPNEASKYLNRIIESEGPDTTKYNAQVAWARRMKAELLASTNTYHNFVEALQLIEANTPEGGVMTPEDLLLFARLSAARNDGVSRDRAILKLEEVRNHGLRRLTNDELLVLAELYKKQDRWSECDSVMNDLLADFPDDMKLLTPWLVWLLEEGQLKLAERWLQNCQPNSLAAVRTRAQLLVRRGKSQEAEKLLLSIIPPDLPPEKDQTLITVASFLEELGEFDENVYSRAEAVWRQFVTRHPSESLRLAAYLGRRGGPGPLREAFQICQQHVDAGNTLVTIPVGVGILRLYRATLEQNSPYFAQVRSWFESVQRDAADSVSLMIQRSEFEDLSGDYRAVEYWLRQYLKSEMVGPHQKALASNNLAYVLALQDRGDESMQLVEYAISILGPVADLRDTRAMVYLALGDPIKALEDLEAAIADGGETSFKYFHKALAELSAGSKANAARAIARAHELGLETSQLSELEKRQYSHLAKQLEGFEAGDKPSPAGR